MSKCNSNSFLRFQFKQFMFKAIKIAIVFGAGFFIYNKIINHEIPFSQLIEKLKSHNIFTFRNAIILLSLTIINWMLEFLKWKILVNEFTEISYFKATEQTLGSLTASIFTPNRIGEYGAKAIYFEKKYRKRILGITLVGNLSQLLITILFGSIGIILFFQKFNPPIASYKMLRYAFYGTIFFLFFFMGVKKYKFTIKGYGYHQISHFFKSLKFKTLTYSLILSGLRYLVFAHQFYLLLTLFKVEINYIDAMILISCFYLLVSILPSVIILDVIIKGSVALWLFSFINASESIILVITLLMWLLNFAIPSIFGSYFILQFKTPKD